MDLVGDGGDQAAQEVACGAARHLLVQLDEGELRRQIDGDKQVEFALRSSNLGEVDMEIADRIGLEFAFGGGFAFDLRQPGDPVALRHRGRDERVRCGMVGCRAYRQSSSGNKVCLRKATTTASSSTDRTVDLGSFGPVGRSETEGRAFHLATVFGLTRSASQASQALLTMLHRPTDRLCRRGAPI